MKRKIRINAGFVFLVALLLFFWQAGKYISFDEVFLKDFLQRYPLHISGALYSLLYVVITFFVWAAKDIFKIIGAILFGAYWSALFIWFAEFLNSILLVILSRRLGRTFVSTKLRGRFRNLDKKIKVFSFLDLFLLRAIILVPYRFLDVAIGLSKISPKKYFYAVALGSPIRILYIQFFLSLLGSAVFKNPQIIAKYLEGNVVVAVFCSVYFFLTVFLIFRLKKRIF